MPSPKKLPTLLKKIRGTLEKSRVHNQEMSGTKIKKMPHCPNNILGRGKKIWKNTGNKLVKQGILFEEDLPLFECYCDLISTIDLCREEIRKTNKVVFIMKGYKIGEDDGGNPVYKPVQEKNKVIEIYTQCIRALASISAEFGLSPSARASIPASIKTKTEKLDEEMFGT